MRRVVARISAVGKSLLPSKKSIFILSDVLTTRGLLELYIVLAEYRVEKLTSDGLLAVVSREVQTNATHDSAAHSIRIYMNLSSRRRVSCIPVDVSTCLFICSNFVYSPLASPQLFSSSCAGVAVLDPPALGGGGGPPLVFGGGGGGVLLADIPPSSSLLFFSCSAK